MPGCYVPVMTHPIVAVTRICAISAQQMNLRKTLNVIVSLEAIFIPVCRLYDFVEFQRVSIDPTTGSSLD